MREMVLEKNANLSRGWLQTTLENLIIFSKNGFTGRPNSEGNGMARLGIETITGSNSIYVDESRCKYIEIPSSIRESYNAKEGDLFVCRQNGNKNYVGKCAVFKSVTKPTIFSDSLIQLRINQELILSEYLAYFLNSMFGRDQIEQYCSTTAGNFSINGTNLKKTIVSHPSISEQKRIVSKIEELFSKIEYGIENLQKTRLQLNEYKQSILKNAFNGSLTMNWREKHGSQLEKVTEILKKVIENKQGFDDNYLHQFSQDVEALPKLPPQWVWTTIGLVSESMKNGIYKPKSSYSNKGIACLRMYNIEDGELVWKNIKRMNLSQKEISEYELLPNDLLVNRVNSRELVGKTARIPEGVERCVYESKNIRLRLFRNFTNSNLVAYWFKLFRQTFFNRNAQQTVGMASINQEQLSQMPIPYMHISEQNELVKQIEFHFTIAKNSLSLIENNLKYLDKLRNSVLKQTFEGKLVPQDPNDEPAKILLQKMKQEKETLQEKQKDNKTKSRRIKNAK